MFKYVSKGDYVICYEQNGIGESISEEIIEFDSYPSHLKNEGNDLKAWIRAGIKPDPNFISKKRNRLEKCDECKLVFRYPSHGWYEKETGALYCNLCIDRMVRI